MKYKQQYLWILAASIALSSLAIQSKVIAHGGGVLLQAVSNKITTNFDNESGGQFFDVPAYSILFNPTGAGGNNGPIDSPSFLSLATAPGSTDPLPTSTDVYWDFLPMTIDGLTSNLFYWDAIGSTPEDVEFGAVPQANVDMSLFDVSFNRITVDGSAEMVPGSHLGTTDSGGSGLRLHAHRFFFLDDNDSNDLTDPPDGIYLFSMQLRMPGMINSDPFFFVAGTFGVSLAALDSAALPWATDNADSLFIEGDFNYTGIVDGKDFLDWQQQFGMEQQSPSGPFPVNGAYADEDGDGIVAGGDFAIWEQNFGFPAMPAVASIASIPEPSSLALAGLGLLAVTMTQRRRA